MAVLLKLVITTFLTWACLGQQQLNFTNPILDLHSIGSAILHLGDKYYLPFNPTNTMVMYESHILTDFRSAARKDINPYPGRSSKSITSMQILNGELYLYFSHTILEGQGWKWRMHVMKARDSSDPMGEWEEPIQMFTDIEHEVFTGSVMKHGNKLYFVWSRNVDGERWSIFISEMSSPTQTTGPQVMIKEPKEEWECQDTCASYRPSFLYGGNSTYMIFTSSMPNTSLGQMSIPYGKDPMDPNNWEHVGAPVFETNEEEGVFSPVKPLFTDSPDGSETWMVYTARESSNGNRWTVRLEKVGWNEDGSPSFPKAHGFDHPQPLPSGQ